MASNLDIDMKLLDQALKLGGLHTKRETVNEALAEYIVHRKRLKSLDLIGKIDIDPDAGRSKPHPTSSKPYPTSSKPYPTSSQRKKKR